MGPKPMTPASGELFRQTLREQINLKHPLVRLADLIDWERIEAVCATRFASRRGRPATAPHAFCSSSVAAGGRRSTG